MSGAFNIPDAERWDPCLRSAVRMEPRSRHHRVLSLCASACWLEWPTVRTLIVCPAQALLSPTTRMEDVFFGLYHWLDRHPSEAVLVSLNYEPGTGTSDDARLQEQLCHILTGPLAKRYWVQTKDTVSELLMQPIQLHLILVAAAWDSGRSKRKVNPYPAVRLQSLALTLDGTVWHPSRPYQMDGEW